MPQVPFRFRAEGQVPELHTCIVAPRFPIQVGRYARPVRPETQIFLDDLGLLAPFAFPGAATGGLVEAEALGASGSLCLLGEPGAGKTTSLRAMVSGLPGPGDAVPGQCAAVVVSLAEIPDRDAFREMVTSVVA